MVWHPGPRAGPLLKASPRVVLRPGPRAGPLIKAIPRAVLRPGPRAGPLLKVKSSPRAGLAGNLIRLVISQ